jgi:SWI/SNF-related matrix-associated actin-dependent regulator 1 of chromatin subfamily A
LKLHAFQEEGAAFLATSRYAMLADEMGLGKTVQALCAASDLSRVLVACPAIARRNWARECLSWTNRTATVLEKLRARVPAGPGVFVCSYDYLRANGAELRRAEFDVLILDEAQMVKGLQAQRTQAIFGQNGVARSAKRMWWLTGTPLENHPGELWLPLFFSGHTALPYADWIDAYCEWYNGPEGIRITGAKTKAMPQLRELIAKSCFILRRLKRDVLKQLPPMRISKLVVEAQLPKAAEMALAFPEYWGNSGETPRLEELDNRVKLEEKLLAHALEAVTTHGPMSIEDVDRLRGLAQSVSTLLRYNGILSVAPVAELVAGELMADSYEKIFLVTSHVSTMLALQRRLARYGCVTISGETAAVSRQDRIDRFNAAGGPRVMIGQIRACSNAVTLHAHGLCTQVMAVETGWDPASLIQALNRVHRIGQTNAVNARVVVLDDPLSYMRIELLERKAQEISQIMDGRKERVMRTQEEWLTRE